LNQEIREAVVLLVEDNPAEQNLARRSFQKSQLNADLRIVSDGEEALDYLNRRKQFSDPASSPTPDIILLDLNLPKIDGKQVLKSIKSTEELANIPVVVLTTSKKEEDILKSYELGCSSFLVKPVEVEEFVKVLKELGSYWLKLVVLPPKE
jgi:CheY-like chemotaxis protein